MRVAAQSSGLCMAGVIIGVVGMLLSVDVINWVVPIGMLFARP